jgi:hypothetical protein
MTDSTHELLKKWGTWQRFPDLRMNARCGVAIIMDDNVGRTVGEPMVGWDEISQVDSVLAKLKRHNWKLYQIIWLSYVNQMSSREMGVRLHCDQKKALAILNQAVAWVDGAMFASDAQA